MEENINKKGFTLIEVVTSLFIIVLLSGIVRVVNSMLYLGRPIDWPKI